MKRLTFYFSLLSPWVYMAGPRLHEIAAQTGTEIVYRPIDLLRVFRETGGTPLARLHDSRRAYRQAERRRWAAYLDMPVNDRPAHHPVDETAAACFVLAAQAAGQAVWPLAHALLAAVWVRDLDIADPAQLERIANEAGYDGAALRAAHADPRYREQFERTTQEAIELGVFGVPTFIIAGEIFFGQDRLDFVRRSLAAQ